MKHTQRHDINVPETIIGIDVPFKITIEKMKVFTTHPGNATPKMSS